MPKRETQRRKKDATPPQSTASAGRASQRPPASTTPRAAHRRAPLASLRVFVAVAEHNSFTRGADALGLTTSAVSMQVQALEEYLRVPLRSEAAIRDRPLRLEWRPPARICRSTRWSSLE